MDRRDHKATRGRRDREAIRDHRVRKATRDHRVLPEVPGVSDFVVRSATPVEVSANSAGNATASCNAGEVAVGGGYFLVPYYNASVRVNSQSGGDSWYVEIWNNVGDETDLHVEVICAQP